MVNRGAPRLVHGIDVARVEEAVRAVERRTSGEVRVAISRFYFWGDVQRAASASFDRLRIAHTRHRNGILIFVAPWRRRFAICGDIGIHEKVAPTFWKSVADIAAESFRRGDPTAGLEGALALIGDELSLRFPRDPTDDINELPDAVVVPGKKAAPERSRG
jgi:uncharacterized membrane protein